jgi:hypothetical protein
VVEGSLQSRGGGIVPGGSGMLVCDSAGTAATEDAAVSAAERKQMASIHCVSSYAGFLADRD